MQTETTDVLVVGGGTGGVAAAIAAARAGARVIMAEREPVIGGTITNSYVTMPCGRPINGLYAEMIERIRARYSLPVRVRWFLPSTWLAVMTEMLDEAGVKIIRGARNLSPIVEEQGGRPRVVGAVLPLPDGEKYLRAAVTLDATGTGTFAEAAGCEALYGTDASEDFDEPHAPETRSDTVQQCTWMYISQKMGAGPAFDMTRLANVRRGVLDAELGWFHSNREACLERDAGLYLHWGGAVECRDTRDPVALAEAQEAARHAMKDDMELLRENGYAVHLAPHLGVRETRRIVGEHVINENGLRSEQLPEDTIAIGQYSMDIWGKGLSHEATRLPPYGIPYRAMVPRGVDGLLVAGKSISGTHLAMSAYRVQPIVATYSQSAGVAAAWCAAHDAAPRDADITAVRRTLRQPEQSVLLEVPS